MADKVALYMSLEHYRQLLKRIDKFIDTVSSDIAGRDELSAEVKRMLITHNEFIPEK